MQQIYVELICKQTILVILEWFDCCLFQPFDRSYIDNPGPMVRNVYYLTQQAFLCFLFNIQCILNLTM